MGHGTQGCVPDFFAGGDALLLFLMCLCWTMKAEEDNPRSVLRPASPIML